MPPKKPNPPTETPDKERISNEAQTTIYCPPQLWENTKTFVKALKKAKEGRPGPRPPKSASALVVKLLIAHLQAEGAKVGVKLPADLLQKP
jgi:hypothetical protein